MPAKDLQNVSVLNAQLNALKFFAGEPMVDNTNQHILRRSN